MYDCNSDINMLLTTLSLGVKESTFKIGFDSRFNKWFDNIINIHAELNENDTIAKITSYKDDEIFSIFKNSTLYGSISLEAFSTIYSASSSLIWT